MINKKYRDKNCRQQVVDTAGFFVDQSLQRFCIKSNGKIIKQFKGRILVPRQVQSTDTLSMADIKNVFRQGTNGLKNIGTVLSEEDL